MTSPRAVQASEVSRYPLTECAAPLDQVPALLERAHRLPRLDLDPNQLLDLEKLGNGTFSPLQGFQGSAETRSVTRDLRLLSGAPWSIPINLQVPVSDFERVSNRDEIALWNRAENKIAGTLRITEAFELDLLPHAELVFGTADRQHPGVNRHFEGGRFALAGPVQVLSQSQSPVPPRFDRSPRAMREEIERRGFRTITGFQTRNLGHKAHEHLQKIGLELTDGLLIHPLIGWKKAGDMLPDVILEGYEVLVDGYYPKERVILAGLTTAMRYAGPREAVFHSIIRRNFGCTHFIVGRDHAGVGNYYDKYAGHRIFDHFRPDELGITILKLHGPCYCAVCDEIVTERICPHGPAGWRDISGTEVRAMIARGERPPSTIMRPEIGDFLIRKSRAGAVFFEETPSPR